MSKKSPNQNLKSRQTILFCRFLMFQSILVVFLLVAHPAGAQTNLPVANLAISTNNGIAISPLLYGVNYDWDQVPQAEFQNFNAAMANIAHYTLARFPGGWNAEHYDWSNNSESGKRTPDQPGVSAETFVSTVPTASFITPSAEAIADPQLISQYVNLTANLVSRYGRNVRYWEIGNEWWLQGGAKSNVDKRQYNLRNYAALLAAVVPAMKAVNPSIQIFATGDFHNPADFAAMRQMVGAQAWNQIDGISVHSYCGNADPNNLCSQLPTKLAAVRQAAGKQLLYASEWMAARKLSNDDYGIHNANYTIEAFQDLAFAGVSLATYWPPVKVLPEVGFTSANYNKPFATGIAFGLMSTYYRGYALRVAGDLPAVAAKNGSEVTVIVPSGNSGPHLVRIALNGTGLRHVASSEVLYSDAPDDKKGSRFLNKAVLPTTISADGSYVEFAINPGTTGRGSNFEIARVTMN